MSLELGTNLYSYKNLWRNSILPAYRRLGICGLLFNYLNIRNIKHFSSNFPSKQVQILGGWWKLSLILLLLSRSMWILIDSTRQI